MGCIPSRLRPSHPGLLAMLCPPPWVHWLSCFDCAHHIFIISSEMEVFGCVYCWVLTLTLVRIVKIGEILHCIYFSKSHVSTLQQQISLNLALCLWVQGAFAQMEARLTWLMGSSLRIHWTDILRDQE